MTNIRVTKIFDFETSHALYNYDGLCRNIHGHSYKLYVTVTGKPIIDEESPKLGMVIDFGVLKKIVKEHIVDIYDHSLMLYHKEDVRKFINSNPLFKRIHILDFQPTCEKMIVYFAEIIEKKLPPEIKLHSLRLYETANSYAEWFAEDQ